MRKHLEMYFDWLSRRSQRNPNPEKLLYPRNKLMLFPPLLAIQSNTPKTLQYLIILDYFAKNGKIGFCESLAVNYQSAVLMY